jgi:hypothetical protein
VKLKKLKEIFMLEEIAVSKFKATCLRLLGDVKKTGNSIIIARKGEAIAIVSPPPPPTKNKSWMGSNEGFDSSDRRYRLPLGR